MQKRPLRKYRKIIFFDQDARKSYLVDPRLSRLVRASRRISAWAKTVQPFVSRSCVYMLTLTVARPEDEHRARSDRRRFWNSFSRRLRRHGFNILGFCFVTEFQKRGVRHWHLVFVVDRPLYSRLVPKWLKADLDLWPWGFTNIVRIEKSVVGYLTKYLKKDFACALDKLIRNERLFYCRLDKKIQGLLYRLSALPWSIEKMFKKMRVVDFCSHSQDGLSGWLIITFDNVWRFIPRPNIKFGGFICID